MVQNTQILGFNFTKISVEKNQEYKGQTELKSNIDVSSIEKADIDLVKDCLKIAFKFELDYGELGKILMHGFMILLLNPKITKETLSQWQNKEKISEDVNRTILNIILRKCTLKAIQFEDEIGLPFHIQLPRVQFGSNSNQPNKPKDSNNLK